MAIIKCLLTIALMLVINQDKNVNSEIKEQVLRSLKDVVPTHYNLKLIPEIVKGYFVGSVNINLNVREPTNLIALHMSQLTINESATKLIAKVYNRERFIGFKIYLLKNYEGFNKYTILPESHTYDTKKQLMIIQYKDYLRPTSVEYVLHLKFRGLIEEKSGICKISYTNNKGKKTFLAATDFQLTGARKAFPCWDQPDIKATFELSIKHYPNYTVLSNTASWQSEVDPTDKKLWTLFEKTPIMSTNILGFVIADYDHISNIDFTTNIWGSTHLVHNATYYLDVAENATRELEKFTNSTMSVPKIDHVAVSKYPVHAFSSWGMIVYEESVLFKGLLHDKIITIVHELAHQWFGNLVSPVSWDYLWLSEGTSTYLSYYIANAIFKQWRFMELFVVKEELSDLYIDPINCFKLDTDVCTPMYRNITRTGALLRMISHFVREDVFRNGLIKYLQTHKYCSATPDDLWKALQDAFDESNVQHNNFNVKEVMDTWINQQGYPVVKINRDYDTNEIKVTQHKRVNFWNITETEGNNAWWIPLNFMTKRNLNSSSTLPTHWLNPYTKSITIKGILFDWNRFDWIIVNKQLTGCYHVNYDEFNWMRIAEFLLSDDYDKIPPLNRAQIIIDVQYMMETEGLNFNIFLEVISYLWHEIDPVPWYRALDTIQSLASLYLSIPDAAVIFKPYFFNLTYKLLDNIGLDDNDSDDPMTIETRSKLIKFACLYEIHPECSRKATAKLLAFVEDPIANRISSNKNFLLCCGLMRADESIWNRFLSILYTKGGAAEFFGCSKNLNIIKYHLSLLRANHNLLYLFKKLFVNLPLNIDATDIIMNEYKEIDANLRRNCYLRKSPTYATFLHKIILSHLTEKDIKKMETSIEQLRFYPDSAYFLNNEYLDDRRRTIRKLNENLSKVQTVIKEHSYFYERNFLNKTYKLIVDGFYDGAYE